MHAIHLTLLFAGLCALLQCALTILVIVRRVQAGVPLSDGGDSLLLHRIRAHGNFTETAPMALILLGLLMVTGLWTALMSALQQVVINVPLPL